jgi:hypothetical protein
MRKLFLALFLITISAALSAQQTLNNDAVIKLTRAGLTPDLIITTINASPGTYDTSTDALIMLKKAGVSDKVVTALLAKNTAAAAPAATPPPPTDTGLPAAVDTVGIYYKDQAGNWREVPVEMIDFKSKTSGTFKHIATAGVMKGERDGLLSGTHSHLPIKTPAEFILYLPEGRSPGEYELVRLRTNGDAREFRAAAQASTHESNNTPHDNVDFTSRKIAPRVYAVTIDSGIGKGEYGFLPPAESDKGKQSTGKMYSFTIADSISQ